MRLLHVAGDPWGDDPLDISLCERYGADIPRYMILSHRWRDEEVLFADITHADPSVARSKKGWGKLETSCRKALQMKISYVWNDTCCIDKSSSAELSEAINSMYQFYARSNICLAYLDDVDDRAKPDDIGASEWFTRAWTLQELIAPKELYMYSKGWKGMGTKQSLCNHLTQASHVPKKVLTDPSCLEDFCVAERMQWAAWREATREEDEVYSLMGIFGVNMPPLYGEGRQRAFRRLQIEIMQRSHDHTIFAWNHHIATGNMLATSPRDFMSQHTYRRMKIEAYVDMFALQKAKLDYSMTNIGLHIELPVAVIPNEEDVFLALIACRANNGGSFVALPLAKSTSGRFTRWFRAAWRDCTVYHLSDLENFSFEPKELWICDIPQQRSHSSSLAQLLRADPQLSYHTPEGCTVYRTSQFQQTSLCSKVEVLKPGGFKFSLSSPCETLSLVHIMMFSKRSHEPGLTACKLLAFGELSDRRWIFTRPVDDVPNSQVFRVFQVESAKLLKDCAFPQGIIWNTDLRGRLRFLRLSLDYPDVPWIPRVCYGSFRSFEPYRWSCVMSPAAGSREVLVKMDVVQSLGSHTERDTRES